MMKTHQPPASSSPCNVMKPLPGDVWMFRVFYVDAVQKVKLADSPKARDNALERLRTVLEKVPRGLLNASVNDEGCSDVSQALGQTAGQTSLGVYALSVFAAWGTAADIALCADWGVDFRAKDETALLLPTPLMRAVAAGNVETVRAFLGFVEKKDARWQAYLNHRNFWGQTALDLAGLNNGVEMLTWLNPFYSKASLKSAASLNAYSADARSAEVCAFIRDWQDTVQDTPILLKPEFG